MLSKTALHAILAMTALGELEEGTYAGAAALAERINAPPNYLGKLLQSLARAGLVSSRKGLGGGFRLTRPAREITLMDVLEPLEDVGRWSGCFLHRRACRDAKPCAVHAEWRELRQRYLHLLRKTTIADLVEARELDGRGN